MHVGPMNAESRGSVRIRSADPFDKPAIHFNYLDTARDRRDWVEAVRAAREVLNQAAFDGITGGELSPGGRVNSDEEILDWVKRDAETAAVVDPQSMEVYGVDGLRVVDASVLPLITNGNIYSPTMMVAEKAADLILGNTPLPPLGPEYYST